MGGARRSVAGALQLVRLAGALLVPPSLPVKAHSSSPLLARWSPSLCIFLQHPAPPESASDVVCRPVLSQECACHSVTALRPSAAEQRPDPFAPGPPFRPLQDLAMGLYVHHLFCSAGRSYETTKKVERASGKAKSPPSAARSDSPSWVTLRVQDSACWLAEHPAELRTRSRRIAESRQE